MPQLQGGGKGSGAFCPFCSHNVEEHHFQPDENHLLHSTQAPQYCILCKSRVIENAQYCKYCDEFVNNHFESVAKRALQKNLSGYCDQCGREAMENSSLCEQCYTPPADSIKPILQAVGYGHPTLCLTCGHEFPVDPDAMY